MASHSRARADAAITDSEPVDHPDRETVEVRQLIVSLAAAAAVAALLLIFFYGGNT
jgi:hypothetical protein